MGKHLLSSSDSTVQFQNNKSGCMWGILHILHYHHWRNVKKVFPHKKRHRRRHARHERKTNLHNHSISEDQQLGDVDVKPLLVSRHSKNASATENRSKEASSKGWVLSFHSKPHHMESSDKSATETKKLDREISSKFKERNDVLEVFKAEKNLLLKFLRDLDVGEKSFQNKKARLTKCGSFPMEKSSQIRNINSRSTLKHKQNEIWAFPKGEKLLAGTEAPQTFAKDISYMNALPFVSDHEVDSDMKQNSDFSLSRPSRGLNHKGWNQLVLHRFKVIKQKIKHALTEFTKNGYQTSYRALPENRLGKEVSQSLVDKITENRSSNMTKASDNDSNKHEVRFMRRTSSLNESLDRYTQLFEQSFGKDPRWHSSLSKSLKVTNEDKNHTSGYAPKLSKRNLSLPSFGSLSFILHEAIYDANDTGSIPAKTSSDYNKKDEADVLVQQKSVIPVKKDKPLDDVIEIEVQEKVESSGRDVTTNLSSNLVVEKHEPEVEDGSSYKENVEIEMIINQGKDIMEILDTSCEESATNTAEGTGRNTRGSGKDEMYNELPKTESRYSLPEKETNKRRDNYFLLFGSDVETDSDFNYVKHIIEVSGFMENEHTQMWHTENQPLKPSLFKDLEASLFKEIECSGKEISIHNDHQLLFNIVNEVLLEIYEGSSTYFPRPFSFNLLLRPVPKGSHLLKEVWTRVNSYLSLRPELDQTLDDVVGRDLARSGWMNLQWEEECVALELEDMIVDDLLDEIIFS